MATILFVGQIATDGGAEARFIGQVAGWLWYTVGLASLVAVIAERRGARRRGLHAVQKATAKRLRLDIVRNGPPGSETDTTFERVPADALRPGMVILVETGETIPADGEVIEGVAEVDELSITGESAPVIRESGGERSTVIAGRRFSPTG